MEVYFLTDPLCPWSWAMEPIVASLRGRPEVEVHSIMAAWLPSVAVKPADVAKREWADAAAKTGASIDPTYWDRVAPTTSLVAMAAVKSAGFQSIRRGDAFLAAVREAIFARSADPTDLEVLVGLAAPAGLKPDLFRVDLGVGRFTADDVVRALDPSQPVSESVWWFGRRRMLRSWLALAEDLRNAERTGLACPAFHVLRGKKEAVVKGFATEAHVDRAIASVG